MLVDKGANTESVNTVRLTVHSELQDGVSALSMAIVGGHVALVRLLLENGADVNAADEVGLPEARISIGRKIGSAFCQ